MKLIFYIDALYSIYLYVSLKIFAGNVLNIVSTFLECSQLDHFNAIWLV